MMTKIKVSELKPREVEIYNAGFDAGYEDCFDEGDTLAYENGFDAGWNAGFEAGYLEGKEEMDCAVYEEGYRAGCHNTLEDMDY